MGRGALQQVGKQEVTLSAVGKRVEISQRSNAETTSHPVVSALKICISSKRLRSEVRKKALLEIQ